MPISSESGYLAALVNRARVLVYRRHQATAAGRPNSGWVTLTGPSGVAPTTAVTVDRSTLGAIRSAGSRIAQITGVQISNSTAGVTSSGMIVICDRLSHQGGLVANIATPQTTNLPTAALTRYTDGVGVWIALEIYTLLGVTTTVTATVSYTNQAGTAGRIGTCLIGGSGLQSAGIICIVALQAGDTGARSVESVTLSGTTGAAGSFGVTLFRPLSWFSTLPGVAATSVWVNSFGGCMALPPIEPDACLMPVFFVLSSSNGVRAELSFVEG